jgi:DivIVA domain-containing protein
MARVKRATSQLVRWHSEYENALADAHDVGVPDRALADTETPRLPSKSRSPTPTPPFLNPGGGRTSSAGDDENPESSERNTEPSTVTTGHPTGGESRERMPSEVRDVSFPTAVRGYDRRAVDTYVKRVNRLIAELEVSSSPQAAVRNALDRVGEQTSGILQRAREAAEEISAGVRADADEIIARANAEAEEINATARSEADEITARANADAGERLRRLEEEATALKEQADTRMRKLSADTEAIRQEHAALVEEIHRLAARLEEIASAAAVRFPHREPSEQAEEKARLEEGDAEPAEVVTADDPSGATPAAAQE